MPRQLQLKRRVLHQEEQVVVGLAVVTYAPIEQKR